MIGKLADMSDQASRTVVSMPSLDAVDDDISVSTETTAATLSEENMSEVHLSESTISESTLSEPTLSETGLAAETSFTSAIPSEPIYSTNSEESAPESFSSAPEAYTTNTETYTTTTGVLPTEESFASSDTPSVDPNQLLESSETEQPVEEELIKSSEESEMQVMPEESVALLHQEDQIDEQAEDDPSIAIDQFIKKIADEQLSSKRRELDNDSEHPQENAEESETSQSIEEPTQGESSLEATLTGVDQEDSKADQAEAMTTEEGDQLTQETSEEPAMDVEEQLAAFEATKETSEQSAMDVEEQLAAFETRTEESQQNVEVPQRLEDHLEKCNDVVEPEQPIKTEIAAVQPKEQPPKPPRQKSPEKPVAKPKENLPDMMLDSSEVSRDPFLIALAQEEIRKLDILVCGGCHLTFYMMEEFQQHKNGQCTDVSSVLNSCENEGKPQVWGFCLWKARYLKECGERPPRPWSIYQKWCKLPQMEKNAWITAGQSVQYISKIGNAKVASLKKKQAEKDPLSTDTGESNKENSDVFENSANLAKKTIVKPVKLNNDVTILPSNKTIQPSATNRAVRTTKNSSQKSEYVVERILAKRFNPRRKTWEYQIKWENFDSTSNTWEPISNLSHCKLMLEQFEEQLKRVKEEKARQAALAAKGRGRPTKPSPAPSNEDFTPGRPQRSSKQKATSQIKSWVGGISDDEEKQGTKRYREEDDDDNDADYEAFEKKMKYDDSSEDSDGEKRKSRPAPPKKVTSTPARTNTQKPTAVNIKSCIVGQKSKQEILPSNILIPDANGVVRINQKQLPALSSGVYIMSKTAGIIKLDSTTSKVATSGGQTIVKVAPKIGQTQIKIVKKDGNTTKQIVQVHSPQKTTSSQVPPPVTSSFSKANTPKTYTSATNRIGVKVKQNPNRVISKPKAVVQEPVKPVIVKPPTPPADEESDDGLEPLEFPDEIIIPEPESDNTDFELDPETGKVKGVEYVDKPVVIKEEPGSRPPTTNELENIVTLAAADIMDNDDLTNGDASPDEDPLEVNLSKTSYRQYVTKNTNVGQGRKPEGSLLNKALTGSQTLQRTSSGGQTPQQRMQPKIATHRIVTGQSVGQRSAGGLTTRIVTHQRPGQQQSPMIRKVVTPTPKPRFSVGSQQRTVGPGSTMSRIMPQQAGGFQVRGSTSPAKMQVYSTKSQVTPGGGTQIVRRVGYGMHRSTTTPQIVQRTVQKPVSSQKPPQAKIVQRYYTSPSRKETPQIVSRQISTPAKPKQIMSMPSLIGEEEIPPTPKLAAKPQLAQGNRSPTKSFSEQPKAAASAEELKEEAADGVATADLSTFTMADSDNPIYITGDDGTVYQVAGQNEQGQTILITQGPDGQQQCLLVTNEVAEGSTEEATDALTQAAEAESETAADDAEQAIVSEDSLMIPLNSDPVTTEASTDLQTPLQIKTDIDIEESTLEDSTQDQVVAQVVRAEPPSPGGTHKVVVMLPDGNLMVTQVSAEEYANLELD